jgi:hypothetical protein
MQQRDQSLVAFGDETEVLRDKGADVARRARQRQEILSLPQPLPPGNSSVVQQHQGIGTSRQPRRRRAVDRAGRVWRADKPFKG